jgi:hypothetical protein
MYIFFLVVKLKSSFGKFYRRHYDMVTRYWISLGKQSTNDYLKLYGTH